VALFAAFHTFGTGVSFPRHRAFTSI